MKNYFWWFLATGLTYIVASENESKEVGLTTATDKNNATSNFNNQFQTKLQLDSNLTSESNNTNNEWTDHIMIEHQRPTTELIQEFEQKTDYNLTTSALLSPEKRNAAISMIRKLQNQGCKIIIVLAIDSFGCLNSMWDDYVAIVKAFIDDVFKASQDAKVSIVSFADDAKIWTESSNSKNTIKLALDAIYPGGRTYGTDALEKVKTIINKLTTSERKNFITFFVTDGKLTIKLNVPKNFEGHKLCLGIGTQVDMNFLKD